MKQTLIVLLTMLFACNTTEPPPPYVRTVELTAEDASCTESWIRVRVTNGIQPPVDLRLARDGQALQTLRLTTTDSLLIDEELLPNRRYTYKAYRLTDSRPVDSSDVASISTMDTTSHNFTWQIDTLGVTSSVLYDVAIINDTLAYAVGEIMVLDSLGNLINPPYNIAKWNGHRWDLMRILYDCRLYYPNCGPEYYLYAPGRSIFAFGANDVWIAAGTAQHWDGVRWTEYAGIEGVGTANKIWGSSSNDLYFVGYGGFIVHKSGNTWQRVESGTGLTISDVYGVMRSDIGGYEILCVADADGPIGESKILSIANARVTILPTDGLLSGSLWGVWFVRNRKYMAVGDGLWQTQSLSGTWERENNIPPLFKTSISGQWMNDIVVCGAFWLLAHWNGVTWHSYFPFASGSFTAIAMQGNKIIAVGGIGSRAIVACGTRHI